MNDHESPMHLPRVKSEINWPFIVCWGGVLAGWGVFFWWWLG